MAAKQSRRRTRIALSIVSVCLLLGGLRLATAGVGDDAAVIAAFDRLEDDIRRLPSTDLTVGQRTSLIQKIENAQRAYLRNQPCTTVAVMHAYLNETQALRRGSAAGVIEDLFNRGWTLRQEVLAASPDVSCNVEPVRQQPGLEILASDNAHFRAQVAFGQPQLWTVNAGGEVWTQIEFNGIASTGEPAGVPAVPVWRGLVAVPRGARIALLSEAPHIASTVQLNLYPFQPLPAEGLTPDDFFDEIPPDSVFADLPFTKDARAYASDASFPSFGCRVTPIGAVRDLQIAQIECAAARYAPSTDVLEIFDSVDVEVGFAGGDGVFLTDAALNRFEVAPEAYAASVLNRDAIGRYVGADLRVRTCVGEELLILTHPDFSQAAEDLAAWKNSRGILTHVFEVNDGAGPGPDTNTELDQFVERRYNDCIVRPSYLLLFGDADFAPTFYVQRLGADAGVLIASDYPYATVPQLIGDIVVGDFVPELGVGRISVNSLSEGQAIVDKIKTYEGSPPIDASFYQNASIASQFQCCRTQANMPEGTDQRTFIQNSEFVRNRLTLEGKTIQRIYTKTIDQGDPDADPPKPAYTGDPTPLFYSNGVTSLPAALQPPFAWSGSKTDIKGAFAAGRFLILHRDHGGPSGWANPRFTKDDFAAPGQLSTNGRTPFVFSMNCSSGYFDAETDMNPDTAGDSFAETLLRYEGGAVAIIAATRTTNATNNYLVKGFLDAVWPDTLADFGNQVRRLRLGDILNHGKFYMMAQLGVNDQSMVNHLYMHHAFGDPTLAIRTQMPVVMSTRATAAAGPTQLRVTYAIEGATITALQSSRQGYIPIGRGVVSNGEAVLPYLVDPDTEQPFLLTATLDNGVTALISEVVHE